MINFIPRSLLILGIFLSLAWIRLPVRADGPIVYSARYYNARGIRGNSHFHIYTIYPNGSHRRQLTFGNTDDYDPVWSPDGKRITFERWGLGASGTGNLIIINPAGTRLRKIAITEWRSDLCWESPTIVSIGAYYASHREQFTTDGRQISDKVVENANGAILSPNGKFRYSLNFPADSSFDGTGQIVEVQSKKIVGQTAYPYETVMWLSNSNFVGVRQPPEDTDADTPFYFDQCSLSGRRVQTSLLLSDSHNASNQISEPDGNDWTLARGNRFDEIEACPDRPSYLLVWQDWHDSESGDPKGIFLLDTKTHRLKFVAEANFASWSPDKRFFCGVPGLTTSDYPKRIVGRWLQVYTAPLEVVDVSKRHVDYIQDNLVDVNSADWRGGVLERVN